MVRSLFCILVVLFLSGVSSARPLVFKGDRPANADRLQRIARQRMPEEKVIDSLTSTLNRGGYLDAGIDVRGDTFFVNAGTRYLLHQVNVLGDTSFAVTVDEVFTPANLLAVVEEILRPLRDAGYLYAAAKTERVARRDSLVILAVRLTRGPEVHLGTLNYRGLTRTRPELLDRYLPVEPGSTITEGMLLDVELDAAAIPFVAFRPPVELLPQPGYTAADLGLDFEEKRQFRAEGGGGYGSDENAGLLWHLNAAFVNLFGDGKDISIRAERPDKGRNSLAINYRQPVFLVGVGDISLGVATRDFRDDFYEFSVAAEYSTRITRLIRSGLGLEWNSVEPTGDEPSYNRFSATFSTGASNIRNAVNPNGGLALDWSVMYSYRRYGDDSSSTAPSAGRANNDTRATLSVDWYQEFLNGAVMHVGLHYAGLETGEDLPPLSELELVGGPGSLRGYRNDQFSALRTASGTIEPRWRFRRGNLFLFYDGAYLNNRVSDGDGVVRTDEAYYYGYGFGMTLTDGSRSVKMSGSGFRPTAPFAGIFLGYINVDRRTAAGLFSAVRVILETLRLIRTPNCLLAMVGVWLGAFLTVGEVFPAGWVAVGWAAFLACAGGNALNDILDLEIDRINRPRRVLVRGALSRRYALWVATTAMAASILIAAFSDLEVLIVVLSASALLALYNLKLKRWPLIGNAAIGILAGMTFIAGGLAVAPERTFDLPGPLIPAVFAFLMHLVREIVKDIEDIGGDRAVGIVTLPQIVGYRFAAGIAFVLFIALALLSLVPLLAGWFGRTYGLIVIFIVDLPIALLLFFIWLDQSRRLLSAGSFCLKLAMIVGVVALVLG